MTSKARTLHPLDFSPSFCPLVCMQLWGITKSPANQMSTSWQETRWAFRNPQVKCTSSLGEETARAIWKLSEMDSLLKINRFNIRTATAIVTMVSKALAIIIKFSWMDCGEKIFIKKQAWHPYKAHLQHFMMGIIQKMVPLKIWEKPE